MISYLISEALAGIAFCGLAAFLIALSRKMRVWGVIVAIFYLLLLIGAYMGGNLGHSLFFGPIGAIGGALLAARLKRPNPPSA